MTTKLRIAHPDIPKDALVIDTQQATKANHPIESGTVGERHNTVELAAAAQHTYIDYDLGDGNSSSADHLIIARKDWLEDSADVVTLRGSDVGRDAPTLYGTPTLWLKADAGITKDAQHRIATWADQSGNGYDFTQGTDGNKPLQTRADNKENQFTYSEQIDNAAWTKTKLDVTANALANPIDGTVTAELIEENDTTSDFYFIKRPENISTISGVQYRMGGYFKPSGIDWIQIIFGNAGFPANNNANFNITTGAVGVIGGAIDSYTIEDVGSGWYRILALCTSNATVTNLNPQIYTQLADNATLHTGVVGDGFYVYGMQFQVVAADSDYVTTTDFAQYRGVNGLPAIRFDGVNDYMDNASTILAANHDATLFFAIRMPAPTGFEQWLNGSNDYRMNNNGVDFFMVSYTTDAADTLQAGAPPQGTATIVTVKYDDGGSAAMYQDGVSVDTVGSLTGTTKTLPAPRIGANPTPNSYARGAFCELIIYASKLSDANQVKIEEYLAAKYTRAAQKIIPEFSSASGIGPRSNDYISKFDTTAAYRYWSIDYHSNLGTGTFLRSKEYFGTLFDIGKDPSAYHYAVAGAEASQIEFPTGNVILNRASEPRYVFQFQWEGVTDAIVNNFKTKLLSNPREDLVFLYTTDNDQILADNQLIHCRILSQQVTITKEHHKASDSWNTITAAFEEVVA